MLSWFSFSLTDHSSSVTLVGTTSLPSLLPLECLRDQSMDLSSAFIHSFANVIQSYGCIYQFMLKTPIFIVLFWLFPRTQALRLLVYLDFSLEYVISMLILTCSKPNIGFSPPFTKQACSCPHHVPHFS